jgi:hypothetical protein
LIPSAKHFSSSSANLSKSYNNEFEQKDKETFKRSKSLKKAFASAWEFSTQQVNLKPNLISVHYSTRMKLSPTSQSLTVFYVGFI